MYASDNIELTCVWWWFPFCFGSLWFHERQQDFSSAVLYLFPKLAVFRQISGAQTPSLFALSAPWCSHLVVYCHCVQQRQWTGLSLGGFICFLSNVSSCTGMSTLCFGSVGFSETKITIPMECNVWKVKPVSGLRRFHFKRTALGDNAAVLPHLG